MSHQYHLELAEAQTLYELADRVYQIRTAMLCAESAGLDDIAEQHTALAFSSLDAAIAQLKLAGIHQARAIAGAR